MRSMRLILIATCGALTSVASAQMGAGAPDVPNTFVERPGMLEFSGRMIVRPKSVADFQSELRLDAQQAQARFDAATARLDNNLLWTVPETREFIIDVPAGSNENTLSAQLMGTGDYEYVEPDWICYPNLIPNDPRYGQQWHHNRMNTDDAWNITQGGGVRLGFVDSGWDVDHEDLVGRVVAEYNSTNGGSDASDINGHGTHVGGCIGATGNNGRGVAGMGWDFELVCVRATNNPNGSASMTALTAGARWAILNGDARAVSVSFTGVQSSAVETTGFTIWQAGGIMLWAADNFNQNHSSFDHQHVIVVGASTQSDGKAGFSSYGRAIDVFAPGVGILSTTRNGSYQAWNGTSMATPIANGLIGLIWSVNPDFTNQQVQDILFASCTDIGAPGEDDVFGHGRIDAADAIQMAADTLEPSPPVAADDQASAIGEAIVIDVLANDSDINGDEISILSFDETSALGGTVEVAPGQGEGGRDALLYTPSDALGDDTFTYTIEDETERTDSAQVTITLLDPDLLRRPENPIGDNPGLLAEFYYDLDNPTQLPDFEQLDRNLLLIVDQINYASSGGNFAGSGRADNVGAVFSGWVTVDEPGIYTFYTESDDGSALFIGDQMVVDNDGLHGMVEESGEIGLQAGTHELRVEFFERTGGAGLIVRYEAAGLGKTVIPPAAFSFGGDVPDDEPTDWNGDGVVNAADVGAFLSDYFLDLANGTTVADYDENGVTNAADVGAFLSDYFTAL